MLYIEYNFYNIFFVYSGATIENNGYQRPPALRLHGRAAGGVAHHGARAAALPLRA